MAETIGAAIISAGATAAGASAASAAAAASATAITVAGQSITYAAIVGNVVITAASIGAQYALSQLNRPGREPSQSVLQQAAVARFRAYGEIKTSGAVALWEAHGSAMSISLLVGHGKIDEFIGFWSGNEKLKLDGSNNVTSGHLNGYCTIEYWDGDEDQTRTGSNITALHFPSLWSEANHRCRGIPVVDIVIGRPADELLPIILPNGIPRDWRVHYRGARVYDPRVHPDPDDGEWSDNPALCILDYLRHDDGARIPIDWINVESFTEAANHCDEQVRKIDGWEARYRLWGIYTFDEEARQVLSRMLATCDGELYLDHDGLVSLRLGKDRRASVVLTDEHISTARYEGASSRLTTVNEVRYKWLSPEADFTMPEGPAITDAASIAALGQTLSASLSFDMVPSQSQAHRLAHRHLKRKAAPSYLTIETDAYGLLAVGEDVVRVTYTPLDIDAEYKVLKLTVADIGRVTMELAEIADDTFDDPLPESLGAEIQQYPADAYNAATVVAVPTPDAVAIWQEDTPDGDTILVISCEEPSDTTLRFQAEYQESGATAWTPMTMDGDASPWTGRGGAITVGTTYLVRYRFVTVDWLPSYQSYSSDTQKWPASITVATNSTQTPPTAAALGFVDNLDGTYTWSWTQPVSAGFLYTSVRTGSTAFGDTWPDFTHHSHVYGSGAKSVTVSDVLEVKIRSFNTYGAGSTY